MKLRKQTILYVEDDPHHSALVLRALDTGFPGSHVVHVEDGEAALAYVNRAQGSERPRLILLDLRLPKLDGLEVLAALKADEAHASIPVVVLSTSDNERDIQRAYESNTNSYLVKPTSLSSLERMLHDLQEYWLGWNHTVGGDNGAEPTGAAPPEWIPGSD